jgi:hypothetical protein
LAGIWLSVRDTNTACWYKKHKRRGSSEPLHIPNIHINMVYKSKLPAIEEPKIGIIQFIFANTNNTPEDKPLLIDALDNRFITYAQLKDSVLRFGAGLQDVCGFNTDDVLAIYAPNQVNFL